MGLTGQCPSVVGVDARGDPTGPGLIYRDNRAVAEAERASAGSTETQRSTPGPGTCRRRSTSVPRSSGCAATGRRSSPRRRNSSSPAISSCGRSRASRRPTGRTPPPRSSSTSGRGRGRTTSSTPGTWSATSSRRSVGPGRRWARWRRAWRGGSAFPPASPSCSAARTARHAPWARGWWLPERSARWPGRPRASTPSWRSRFRSFSSRTTHTSCRARTRPRPGSTPRVSRSTGSRASRTVDGPDDRARPTGHASTARSRPSSPGAPAWWRSPSSATASGPIPTCAAPSPACPSATIGRASPGRCSRASRARSASRSSSSAGVARAWQSCGSPGATRASRPGTASRRT